MVWFIDANLKKYTLVYHIKNDDHMVDRERYVIMQEHIWQKSGWYGTKDYMIEDDGKRSDINQAMFDF